MALQPDRGDDARGRNAPAPLGQSQDIGSLTGVGDPVAVIEALLSQQREIVSPKEYIKQLRQVGECVERLLKRASTRDQTRLSVLASNVESALSSPRRVREVALIRDLERSVKTNPDEAFTLGKKAHISGEQLRGESSDAFLKRIYLVAFSGRYGSAHSERPPYPQQLRALVGIPSTYFQGLARSIMNERIEEATRRFEPSISVREVRQRFSGTSLECEPHLVVMYLKRLITQPLKRANQIWREVCSERSFSGTAPAMHLWKDLVEEQGRRRAKEACAVLHKAWTEPWRPSPRLMRFVHVRLEEQKSVREVRSVCGWKLGLYSALSHESRVVLPALADLSPRMKR
jgi:hypothetical protein